MAEFKLSASLAGHDEDVRGVSYPSSKAVLSASRDGTVRLWKPISDNPLLYDASISSHATAFVNCVAYLPTSSQFPEGLIISGGKDTIIEVREPSKGPEDNAEALLLGHTSNICVLDVDPAGKFIVSGSWDGQARIWPVGKWECQSVLNGHDGSVWAVLVFDSETIITGCADQHIRIFHISGKLLRKFQGKQDVVRALCRLPQDHPSGADFASASNDGIIRLWTIGGGLVGELHGHDSFIYSLSSLPSGEIVSSGEDRTLRIWKGNQCVQTLTHPAISVWSVAVCPENGDIVTGASDRMVRIFTRSPERVADGETLKAFEDAVKGSAIPQQQLPQASSEELPGPDFLTRKSGTKDGQIQVIRELDGSKTAHMWSTSSQSWNNVGVVVDQEASSGKKVAHQGKDYDYVFDVDIEEGKPPLKLPYNVGANPYDAARKFIEGNKLPMTYIDQVANFITTNTQGATLGVTQEQPSAPGSDPWGSDQRYRPDGVAPQTPQVPKILPQKDYLSILVARVPAIQKKIQELNRELLSDGHKDISLNPTELTILASLCKHLESSGATTTSQTVSGGLELAIKLATVWPYADRLPGLDLLRLLAVAPKTATLKLPSGANIIHILSTVTENEPPAENHIMMAIRSFSNLFATPEGRVLSATEFSKIQNIITPYLESTNRNLLVATTTVYINYAVFFNSSATAGSFDTATAILEKLGTILEKQKDSEVVYRALVALGTLLGLNDEVRQAAKEVFTLGPIVEKASAKATDPRVKNVAKEIAVLLQ